MQEITKRLWWSGLAGMTGAWLAIAANCRAEDAPPVPVTDIPRIQGVEVRDAVTDWKGQGLVVRALAGENALLRDSTEFAVLARLGWNDEGVLLQVDVTDSTPWEQAQANRIFEGDSVELCLTSADRSAGMEQLIVSAGVTDRFPQPRVEKFDYRSMAFKQDAPDFTPRAVRQKTEHGYIMDLLLPWTCLKIKPELGTVVGVEFSVNDSDGKSVQKARWLNYQPVAEWMNFPQVRLAEKPSAARPIAVWAGYDELKSTYINAVAEPEAAMKTLDVLRAGKVVAHAVLALDGGRAVARMQLPAPSLKQTVDSLEIQYDGQPLETLPLPDAAQARKELFLSGAGGSFNRSPGWLRPVCKHEIFSGDEFPGYAYPDPDRIKQLVGGFTLETAYYDAQFERVSKPAGPGRYGAVTTVIAATGDSFIKYQTLYCAETDAPPAPSSTQSSTQRFTSPAVMRSGLAENPKATALDTAKADREWWHTMRTKLGTATRYEYYVRLPKGYDDDKQKLWPVIFYLHGSGRGDDPQRARDDGIQIPAREKADFPFIAVSLRSPGGWEPPAVREVIDEVAATCRTDPKRYYLAGFSMGAGGTWAVAQDEPDRFAAIVMVGGGSRGDVGQVTLHAGMAAWVINGADDTTAPAPGAVPLVEALRAAGVEVKSTVIPHAGHVDSDDTAYRWDELYTWLLEHHR